MRRKLTYIFTFIFLMLIGSAAKGQTKEINIQFFSVYPHIFLDENTGKPAGAVYELIENYIAPEMGVKFNWDKTIISIPRQLENFKTKKGLASALFVYNPERAAIAEFSEKPFFFDKPSIAVLKENKLAKIVSVDDIAHLKIGYTPQAFVSPFMKSDKIHFEMVSSADVHESNLKKMQAKRIDAAFCPGNSTLLYLMRKMNLENEIKVLTLPDNPVPYFVVFSKDSKDLVEKYNKAFNKLNVQELYIKLLGKYLDVSKL